MASPELFLHEELMLLALKDREGTVAGGTMYSYAIGGAVLAEFLLSDRVTMQPDGKKSVVTVSDPTPFGDPLLDDWLAAIASEKKFRDLGHWVARIAGTKDLKHRVATQLCRRGILRTAEDKVLLIFTRKIYPELDPAPERRLMGQIESAIFHDGDVDPRLAVLIAVANTGGVLQAVFKKSRLKDRKGRIKEISEGTATADATKEAIEAMQAAIFITTIFPAVMTTTIVTS